MENIVEKQGRKKMTPKQKKDLIFVWSMLAVFIVYWLVFYLYVNFDSILLAFQKVGGGWTMDNITVALRALGEGGSEFQVAIRYGDRCLSLCLPWGRTV